jgi:hypothetical protein
MSDSKFPRDLNTLLSFSHTYIDRFREKLDSIQPNLWANLGEVPRLHPAKSKAVVSCLLEFACQCQNMLNIELGRAGLLAIPRDWLLQNIEETAEPLLVLCDDWEYRRLIEFYWEVSEGLVRRLGLRGLESDNSEIKEAAEDFLRALDSTNTA